MNIYGGLKDEKRDQRQQHCRDRVRAKSGGRGRRGSLQVWKEAEALELLEGSQGWTWSLNTTLAFPYLTTPQPRKGPLGFFI